MKKYILLFIIISVSFKTVFSQTTEPIHLIDRFYEIYNTNIDSAIDYIFNTNPSITFDKKAQLLSLKQDFTNSIEQLGNYRGYELITTRKLTSSYMLYSYLVKYDLQPLRLTFVFYKPENEWHLYNFKYDVEFATEFDKSAELYFLKEIYYDVPK